MCWRERERDAEREREEETSWFAHLTVKQLFDVPNTEQKKEEQEVTLRQTNVCFSRWCGGLYAGKV